MAEFINSEYVFIMDCDLQHDLNAIPIMIKLIKSDSYDLVIGQGEFTKLNHLKEDTLVLLEFG